jgi:hypothetical protein
MLSASCGSGSTPTAQPTSPAPSTSPATSTPTGTPSPPATPTSPAAFRYQPLWPFTGPAQAAAWQANHPGGGADAWRYDARRTALSFTRDYLHITDVDRTTSARVTATDAHVGVGFATEGGRMGTAAVVHLVRIGAGPDAPWEVVGTDDTTLTLTRPSYGATVGSPTVVGGRVTGVDENLRVKVFVATAVDAVGSACCVAAGGERTPWSMSVPYRASSGQVLTVVVMTGGHLKAVERFAVTGVRAR